MAFSIQNLKIRQQILLVTLPPIFVLLCSVALMLYTYWMARESDRAARKSEQSITQVERFHRRLTETYMGVRGYLLTGEPSQLRA